MVIRTIQEGKWAVVGVGWSRGVSIFGVVSCEQRLAGERLLGGRSSGQLE